MVEKKSCSLPRVDRDTWDKLVDKFRCYDMTLIPKEVQMYDYSSKGDFVYIKPDFEPFMRLCDRSIAQYMNSDTEALYGKKNVEITKLQLKSNTEIYNILKDIVFFLIPDDLHFDGFFDLLHSIWIEKFSNARINDIRDGFARLEIESGECPKKTVNVRDKLLYGIAE